MRLNEKADKQVNPKPKNVKNMVDIKKDRPYKGLSVMDLPENYCCIDIETTGFMPNYDEIVEICGIKVRSGKIVENYSTLIKPIKPIDSFITELSGVTNEMLEGQPRIEEVAIDFYNFLSDEILLGHNTHFDINFLYDAFEKILNKPLRNNFIDLMRISRHLFQDFKNHKLATIAKELGVNTEVRHRAEADCITTIKCLEECRAYIDENEIDIYTLFRQGKNGRVKLRADSIVSETTDFDPEHPLYYKVCVFTGALEKMVRKEAMQAVVNVGGKCKDNVSRDVNLLILGNNDYCSTIKDGKSSKQKKAEGLILKGHDLQIIPEDVFYELLFY